MYRYMQSTAKVAQRRLEPQRGLSQDVHLLAPFLTLLETVQASPSKNGCPSYKVSCLRFHGQCLAELDFRYRSRFLHCAHGVELRREENSEWVPLCV